MTLARRRNDPRHRFRNDLAFVHLTEPPPTTLACRRNDPWRLRRAVSHMTKAMTKGVTKPMTKAAAPVQQLARRRLWACFELRPPVAKLQNRGENRSRLRRANGRLPESG